MQCRYLAGHWETDLIRQLGWTGVTDYPIRARPTTYRAPSWSWASVEGRISIIPTHYDSPGQVVDLIEIIAAQIDMAGYDDMGPVKGGYLDVFGRIFHLNPQGEGEEQGEAQHRSRQPLLVEGLITDLQLHEDGPETKLDGPLYCVMLTLFLGEELYLNGLVLQQLGVPNVYQRIGSIQSAIGQSLRRDDPIVGLLGEVNLYDDGHHAFLPTKLGGKTFRIV